MKKSSKTFILIIALGLFLFSCNTPNVSKTPLGIENQTTPTVLPFTTATPIIPSKETAYPTSLARATFEVANATAEALGNICIGSKDIKALEISPNGKWIAATCFRENGTGDSPLQVSSIDRSRNWKIYYSDYMFSSYIDKSGLSPDGEDGVIPFYWSKDGRFLFTRVSSRLSGCCWITGSKSVLLVRLNLDTGEQVALLNSEYDSANTFNFIISDNDRYLLFTPPSYNQLYDFAILDFQTWKTQEIFLKVDKEVHMAYARLSPKEDKVIIPLFIYNLYDDYYADSIALIDLVSGKQDLLITGIKPEDELFPIQWIDDNHVLISNVNPVYNSGDKAEKHWILDITSGLLEEETP